MTQNSLNTRLNTYLQSARSTAVSETLRQRIANWPAYAAATGSALAMATSASAGTVSYTGMPVTLSVTAASGASAATIGFPGGGHSFKLELVRASGTESGNTFRNGDAYANGLIGTLAGRLEFRSANLAPGSSVSPGNMFNGATARVAFRNRFRTGTATSPTVTSTASHPGTPKYIGFRFNAGTLATPAFDYGYLEFVYANDGSGFPDSVTFEGGAYDNTGVAITVPSTPEPATAGLMLLALGAAGVTALRRHKRQAAK